MKQFECGDVVPGCRKVFVHDNDDEILGAVAEHAREAHGLTDIPTELVEQVRSRIRDKAAA